MPLELAAQRIQCRGAKHGHTPGSGWVDTPSVPARPCLRTRLVNRSIFVQIPLSRGADGLSQEDKGQHMVLAVPRNEELWADTDLQRVDEVQAAYGDREWYRLSAGIGSKGERWYDWQCWILAEPEDADWGHYLLFRRSVTDTENWQAYVAFTPHGCDLETLMAVAGHRWAIEHAFKAAKQETGLDDYEVRSTHSWYRYATLALLAVVRAADRDWPSPKKRVRRRAASSGTEPARDPAPAVVPGPARAARGAAYPGLVALKPSPPVGGTELPLPSAIPQTAIEYNNSLGQEYISHSPTCQSHFSRRLRHRTAGKP